MIKKITYGTHASQFMRVHYPTTTASTLIVLYHGGFFKSKYNLDYMETLAADLAQQDYLVANVEYPRVGQGLTCTQMLQSIYTSFDAAAAIDPEITNRVAIGHSAGGYYALMLGIKDVKLLRIRRSHIPNKIIAQAPLTDLWRGQQERLSDNGDAIKKFIDSQRAEPASQNIYALMSPLQHPPSDKCTIHLVHGKMDTDVPLDQSIAYSNRFGNFPGTLFLHEFPEANHYDIVNVEHLAWKAQQTMLLV